VTTVIETIEIRAPREAVFAAITDPRRTMEWNSNILEVGSLSEYAPRSGHDVEPDGRHGGLAREAYLPRERMEST